MSSPSKPWYLPPQDYTYPPYTLATVCIWCGKPFHQFGAWRRTIEHLIPRSHKKVRRKYRGAAVPLAAAHQVCNRKRGAKPEWIPHDADGPMPASQRAYLSYHVARYIDSKKGKVADEARRFCKLETCERKIPLGAPDTQIYCTVRCARYDRHLQNARKQGERQIKRWKLPEYRRGHDTSSTQANDRGMDAGHPTAGGRGDS